MSEKIYTDEELDLHETQMKIEAEIETEQKEQQQTEQFPGVGDYLIERVYRELGVNPADNVVKVKVPNHFNGLSEQELPIFSSDKDDNIRILVYNLKRELFTFDHPKADPTQKNPYNDRKQTFYLTRLKVPKENGQKYLIPKGVGSHPFLPPVLVEKWEKKEAIDTLYLTEGYFKAYKGAMHGLDIIGISSITHYADTKTKQIHADIATIIHDCQVKNVVMIYDGDCLNISLKDLKDKKELTRRPKGFLNSILAINQLLYEFKCDVWFCNIKSDEIRNSPKGLDDLLCEYKGDEESIISDLRLRTSSNFFYKLNVTLNGKRLFPYFNIKSVSEFYDTWSEVIGHQEFVYFGTTYKYNEGTGKLDEMVSKEVKNYIRVGDEYFETIEVPTMSGEIVRKLVSRKKSTITTDHGAKVIEKIAKYKTFVNVPSHANYQQVINSCWNKYSPFTHQSAEGEWDSIKEFLHHIFQDHYEYGLDYIQLLYKQPTQMLPILCLVSKERKTGKTTFVDFLKRLFVNNVAILGNKEIQNEFNSFYATKLIIAVDETSLAKNIEMTERLKMLSTSKEIFMQRKGDEHQEIDHFSKYILLSNNETRFIYTAEEENRFWVIKVNPFQTKEKVRLLDEMTEEIPAFLAYLDKRRMFSNNVSRVWFDENALITEALLRLKEKSRPAAEKEIEAWIREKFEDFSFLEELKFDVKSLKNDISCLKNQQKDTSIHDLLQEKFGLTISKKTERYKIPYHTINSIEETTSIGYTHGSGKVYTVKRTDKIVVG